MDGCDNNFLLKEVRGVKVVVYLLLCLSIFFPISAYLIFSYAKNESREHNSEIMNSTLIPSYRLVSFDTNEFISKPRNHYIEYGYGNSLRNSPLVSALKGTVIESSIIDYVNFGGGGEDSRRFDSIYHLLDSLIMDGRYNDAFKILEFWGNIISTCKSKDSCIYYTKYIEIIENTYRRSSNFKYGLSYYVWERMIEPAIEYFEQGRYADAKWLVDRAWIISNKISGHGEQYSPSRNNIILMKMLLSGGSDDLLLNHEMISELIRVKKSSFMDQPEEGLFKDRDNNEYYYDLSLYWSGLSLLKGKNYTEARANFLRVIQSTDNSFLKEFSYLLFLRSMYRELEEVSSVDKINNGDIYRKIKKSLDLVKVEDLHYVRSDVNSLVKEMTKLGDGHAY